MPANLTPVYHAAEERFRQAKTKEEKIAALEEMLAVIPKHKGTDHMQADIKRRIAKLRDGEDEAKGAAKSADPYLIPKEGAGQVVLLGFPNTGKSALVGAVTRAKVTVADYPYSTALPIAGMMKYEDIYIQLVDLPPVSLDEMPKGMAGALRLANLVGLVVDGSSDDCLEQLQGTMDWLRQKRIIEIPGEANAPNTKTPAEIPVIMTKADAPDFDIRLDMIGESLPPGWEIVTVSVNDPQSLEAFRKAIFQRLGIARVYTKIPGKDAEMSNPFILKQGETVLDFAALVHRDFPSKLKHARVWGSVKFPGQSVEKDFTPADGDVVELHV